MISPFAAGAIVTARTSAAAAARLGHRVLILGCGLVAAGLTGLLVLFAGYGRPAAVLLVVPLFVAGLGHGLVVAPNIDLVLRSVPSADNGSASGVVNTAQRAGSALGIAVIGTVLFGTLHVAGPGTQALASAFSHSFQAAIAVNLGLILVTLALAIASPGRRGYGGDMPGGLPLPKAQPSTQPGLG